MGKRIVFNNEEDICKYVQNYISKHADIDEDLGQELHIYMIMLYRNDPEDFKYSYSQRIAYKAEHLYFKKITDKTNKFDRLRDHKQDIDIFDFTEEICSSNFYEIIKNIIRLNMTQREIDILSMIFDQQMTMKDIAKKYQVTMNYVLFLKQRTMNKLKDLCHEYANQMVDDICIPNSILP